MQRLCHIGIVEGQPTYMLHTLWYLHIGQVEAIFEGTITNFHKVLRQRDVRQSPATVKGICPYASYL